jgi:hypothetical protein
MMLFTPLQCSWGRNMRKIAPHLSHMISSHILLFILLIFLHPVQKFPEFFVIMAPKTRGTAGKHKLIHCSWFKPSLITLDIRIESDDTPHSDAKRVHLSGSRESSATADSNLENVSQFTLKFNEGSSLTYARLHLMLLHLCLDSLPQ